MRPKLRSLTLAITVALAAPPPVLAATLCQTRTGVLVVRQAACKRKEKKFDPAQLGLVAPPVSGARGDKGDTGTAGLAGGPGSAGSPGTVGPPGGAVVRDSSSDRGKLVGPIIDVGSAFNSPGWITVAREVEVDSMTRQFAFLVGRDGFVDSVTFYHEDKFCTFPRRLAAGPSTTLLPQVYVHQGNGYYADEKPSPMTIKSSSIFASQAECNLLGGTVPAVGVCCIRFARPVLAMVADPVVKNGIDLGEFVTPFRVVLTGSPSGAFLDEVLLP